MTAVILAVALILSTAVNLYLYFRVIQAETAREQIEAAQAAIAEVSKPLPAPPSEITAEEVARRLRGGALGLLLLFLPAAARAGDPPPFWRPDARPCVTAEGAEMVCLEIQDAWKLSEHLTRLERVVETSSIALAPAQKPACSPYLIPALVSGAAAIVLGAVIVSVAAP